MITPDLASVMGPVLLGVLRGHITEMDAAPEPYRMSLSDLEDLGAVIPSGLKGKSVFVTSLVGTMLKYDSCGNSGTYTLAQGLLTADADPEIIGHIIIADSGGGAANSVPALADAIRKCSKPVVAFVDDVAASACYYAISYCDRIIAAREMAGVGSIGTYAELSGFPKYQRGEDGYITARVYADESTEKNAGYEAALEGDFKVIRETSLNPFNEQFMADIRANRPGVADEHLHGRMFLARDVVGTLVDSIGSLDDALAAVVELAAAAAPPSGQSQTQQSTMPQESYPNLMAIPALEGQVIDQADGTTTLQPSQLAAVEEVLAERESLREENATLNTDLASARETISQRDARISELEASLAAALELANQEPKQEVVPTHAAAGAADVTPAASFEEALAFCQKNL